MTNKQKVMIEKFQCTGCTCGYNTECVKLHIENGDSFWCANHSAGTIIPGIDKICLGLPKGFNKVGAISRQLTPNERSTNIRLFLSPKNIFKYDFLNIPVWSMEEDGYLFIRTYCPRINMSYIDVIKNGKREDICPDSYNVFDFIDEID